VADNATVAARRGSPTLVAGLALAGLLVLAAVAGPAGRGVDPRRQLDPARAGHLPPGARVESVRLADGRELAAERIEVESDAVHLVGRAGEDRIPLAAVAPGGPGAAIRSESFPLGTDRFGRDLAARLLAGGRVSLAVAALAVALALAVGVPIGLLAGLAGPRWDRPALALIEAAQAFPRLFLLVALAAVTRPGLGPVVLLLGLTGWMPVARLVRAEVRTLATRDFVVAARAAGVGPLRLALRHLLPNALAPVAIEGSLAAASAIVAEATLSFLGLGLPPPTPSWGGMIADGRDVLASAWWVSVFPGLALAAAALAFNLIGEGLRDRLDPRARRLEA
jgi:peptide/nickel transport system permease protein